MTFRVNLPTWIFWDLKGLKLWLLLLRFGERERRRGDRDRERSFLGLLDLEGDRLPAAPPREVGAFFGLRDGLLDEPELDELEELELEELFDELDEELESEDEEDDEDDLMKMGAQTESRFCLREWKSAEDFVRVYSSRKNEMAF